MRHVAGKVDQTTGDFGLQHGLQIIGLFAAADKEETSVAPLLGELLEATGEDIDPLDARQPSGVTDDLVLPVPSQGGTDRRGTRCKPMVIEPDGQLDGLLAEKAADALQRVAVRANHLDVAKQRQRLGSQRSR